MGSKKRLLRALLREVLEDAKRIESGRTHEMDPYLLARIEGALKGEDVPAFVDDGVVW